ncbi:MAG: hypothetical protein IPK60_10930 [Sandaracinaceae bacterium]|nr:hypothetical protein [Sandaracinaceae bacterium]
MRHLVWILGTCTGFIGCESPRGFGPALICALEVRRTDEHNQYTANDRTHLGWDTRVQVQLVLRETGAERESAERVATLTHLSRPSAPCLSHELCLEERRAKDVALARLGLDGDAQ